MSGRVRCWLLVGLVVANPCWPAGAQVARMSAPPIFREVGFPPFSPITLGVPIPERAPPMVAVSDHRAAIARSFADTDSIFVEWDAEKRVRALEFLYRPTKGVGEAVSDYETYLGADRQHTVADSAGHRLERWSWKDQVTMFEFSWLGTGEKPTRIWSILRDRAGGQ